MPQTIRLTQQDLKIYPSERLTDTPDGGGLMVKDPLTGTPNELFNPISDTDKTMGAFNIRKVFPAVIRSDTEPLLGGHSIISKPPEDKYVSFLLAKADKYNENREEAINRITAYSIATIESKMLLLSTQSKGARLFQAYQRVEESLPRVGDVFCLRQEKTGYKKAEQYLQIVAVSSEVRTFYDKNTNAEFQKRVLTLETSSALLEDFVGIEYPEIGYVRNPCLILETHVADSASYYGVKKSEKAIAQGDLSLLVNGLMEKVVPTSQIETPIINADASGASASLIDSSSDTDGEFSVYTNGQANTKCYIGNPLLPGSIKMNDLKDKDGYLITPSGTKVAVVDYGRGEILFQENYSSGNISFKFAGNPTQVTDTASIAVDITNRRYNYVITFPSPPSPSSVKVSYMAQGRWYDLIDNGAGLLRGSAEEHGSGSVNYATHTVNFTLGALPDDGSDILMVWGTQSTCFNRANEPVKPPYFDADIETDGIIPSTVNVKDKAGNIIASSDADGVITGVYDGKLDFANKKIKLFTKDKLPKGGQELDLSYAVGNLETGTFPKPTRDTAGNIAIVLGIGGIKEGTVHLSWNVDAEDFPEFTTTTQIVPDLRDPIFNASDDGKGNIIAFDGRKIGTIDYTSGKVTFNPDGKIAIPVAKYTQTEIGSERHSIPGIGEFITKTFRNAFSHYEYKEVGAQMPLEEGIVNAKFLSSTAQNLKHAEIVVSEMKVDLTEGFREPIVPRSIRFSLGNDEFYDNNGKLYYKMVVGTGVSTQAGYVNYSTGVATITAWQPDSIPNYKLRSLLTSLDKLPIDGMTWRIPSAPVSPQSLQVIGATINGTNIHVTADSKGDIKADGIDGRIEYKTGVVKVKFGAWVPTAGNEGESWYNPDAVVDGKIFKPDYIFAENIKYNAVSYSFLPLDSKVIGIDSARMPIDGLVPIFRKGDMIVIGNTQKESIGSAFTGGQVIELSRQDLDRICLLDANAKHINAELYETDLKAGKITFADNLNLSEYTMPITAHHAQEEENRIIQVDIKGQLDLMFPTVREYSKDGTYISSALIHGDLIVRATAPFSQQAWNKKWSDKRETDEILAKLNVKDFPFVLTSAGSITERWLIVMQSNTQFHLFGELLGLVMKGDILTDLEPINPSTDKPYFKLPHLAFGGGWATGNCIRFNTYGTPSPVWILRAVQPTSYKHPTKDGFTMCLRGNTSDL